jgi:hypothetical protein
LGLVPVVGEKPSQHRPVPTPIAREPAARDPNEVAPLEPESADVHAWLSQRVADLQQERLGIWTRMRSYLHGLGSSKTNQPPRPPAG